MKKLLYCLTGLLIISGCQNIGYSRSAYNQKLSQWLGKSASELYADWGSPDQIFPIDASTVQVSYYSSESQPIDNDFQPYESEIAYSAMAQSNFGLPTEPPLFYCKTSFTISNGIITDYTFNGDDCF